MKYRININWTPDEEYQPEWHEMTKEEYLTGWHLTEDDWNEMERQGAIIPMVNNNMKAENTETPETDEIIDHFRKMGIKAATYIEYPLAKMERERNQARRERNELHDALREIAFFVLDDYYPNCATPSYKAAVEKMQAILQKMKGGSDE